MSVTDSTTKCCATKVLFLPFWGSTSHLQLGYRLLPVCPNMVTVQDARQVLQGLVVVNIGPFCQFVSRDWLSCIKQKRCMFFVTDAGRHHRNGISPLQQISPRDIDCIIQVLVPIYAEYFTLAASLFRRFTKRPKFHSCLMTHAAKF